jgi:hypothetical protein
MRKIYKFLLLLCGTALCASCASQINQNLAPSHPDYKNELPSSQNFCLTPAHPYADVGPASNLPPLASVPASMWKPLPITRDEK